MNGWIALPLTLLLGQTPTSPAPTDERPAAEARPAPTPDEEQAPGFVLGAGPAGQQEQTRSPADDARELELLRAQVQTLRAELEARQLEDQTRLQSLEEQQATLEEQQATLVERARELEQLRQERIESLQRAYQWLITADQRLETGELDIAAPLVSAQQELSAALSSASDTGRGQTARLIESARDRLATVYDSTQERDVHPARVELQAAGAELQEAWRLTLNRSSTSLVSP